MHSISDILVTHNLKKTPGRIKILEVLSAHAGKGLSELELEQQIAPKMDRVTIYRTLNTFVEEHIVHRINDDEGVTRYALCATDCGHAHKVLHDHVHFKCDACKTTECLENLLTDVVINLPLGYQMREKNFLVVGLCSECATQ